MTAKTNQDLKLAFDVGHSSIGWAVLQSSAGVPPAAPTPSVNLLGCGVVTFAPDDCLASKRRQFRQQRRHARATRKRIELLARFLAHHLHGASDPATSRFLASLKPYLEHTAATRQLQGDGDSFAWQRAAEILAAAREGKPLPEVGWPELWDILRWYAHNRGYFAPPWANRGDESTTADADDGESDTEKVEHANALMRELGTRTMAETIAAYTARYEREAAEWQQGQRKEKPKHFKGLNAAFLREKVVWPEVHALLTALKGKLPKLDDALIRTLLGNDVDPLRDRDAWRTVPCSAIQLPKRYHGGLLFGQVIPRFENRIIGVCPIHYAKRQAELLAAGFSPADAHKEAAKQSKLPSKATREFLRYRWAMQIANIFGAKPGEPKTRPLTADERRQLTALAEKQGAFTKGEFKDTVRQITGWPEKPPRDNLDALLLHPDAERALVLDPARQQIHKSKLAAALDALPDRYRKRLYGQLTRGKSVTLATVRGWLTGADADLFDAEVQRVLDAANTKRSKKQAPPTREELLAERLSAEYPKGRAPYARPVLRQAYDEVMQGFDPRAEKDATQPRGCLCQTNELKEAQLQRRLEEQTNNHLIRHRLLILGGEQPKPNATPEQEKRRFKGLLHDLIQEFANGDKSRIAGMTIEVARDLRDLSGKTREEQAGDLRDRLRNFKSVAMKVEEACKRRGVRVTASLIRKARIAQDLKWTCPYTKLQYCIDDLIDGRVDKDHIIPHADRRSDSLDSLVLTFGEVNRMKGKRTAVEFIKEFGGQDVPGTIMICGKLARLSIQSLTPYKEHIERLDTGGSHEDDRLRKRRRKDRLKLEHYEEKEFTPRDLTVTSHLVRLGAQVLQRAFPPEQRPPVNSIPGSVTGEVRKAWSLIGCLEAANPAIMEEVEERDEKTGELKKVRRPKRKKEEIRGITHLHHALDACVLGLAAHYFPRHGTFWSAMVKAGTDRDADDDRRLWLAMTKRRPTPQEAALLHATGLYQADSEGRMHLTDLPEELKRQLRARLAEKRVVQHIPADMSGLGKRIRQNTTGILKVFSPVGEVIWQKGKNSDAELDRIRQEIASSTNVGSYRVELTAPVDEDEGENRPSKSRKPVIKSAGVLLGLLPTDGHGKLKLQRGVRELRDNFGVAILDHAPEGEEKFVIIPWHKVHARIFKGLNGEKSLVERNCGKLPRVLRNGQLIRVPRGTRAGIWRVTSTKNTEAYGLALDLSSPDNLKLDRGNAPIEKLCEDGLEIVDCPLIGVDSSHVKVAEVRRRPRKKAGEPINANDTNRTT